MNCWTNFFNSTALLVALLLSAHLWGCARPQAEPLAAPASAGAVELSSETADQSEPPAPAGKILVAVLPVENLSDTSAPLGEIEDVISLGLATRGFRVVNKNDLGQFRKKHRMRYSGGVSSIIAEALATDLGAEAVLITSLEAYQKTNPPQVSLIARLVSCGPRPEIIWMDSVGLSGDESPGLLDLRVIRLPGELLRKATGMLTTSLADAVRHREQGGTPDDPAVPLQVEQGRGSTSIMSAAFWHKNKYQPYDYFRSPLIEPNKKYTIAVLPMQDPPKRNNAGIIAQLHFVRDLVNLTDFRVLEPGLVREELLRIRAIMPQGPSLAETDLLTGDQSLGADLVLSGKVFDYQNTSSNPKVDLSVQVIERTSRRVVFGARAFNTGLDSVVFYNYGREYTAHNLLKEVSGATVRLLAAPSPN